MGLQAPVSLPTGNPEELPGDAAQKPAIRRRRTREDVTARIREAAAALFAEKGYAGATTREIALRASVSETLLFRHFGNKAALFDQVVCAPFELLIRGFTQQRSTLPDEPAFKADETGMYAAVYGLFEKNPALFAALMTAPMVRDGDAGALPSASLLSFFKEATAGQMALYQRAGEKPPFDLGVATRLSFGMMAASVLFHDWLFPDGAPDRAEIVATLHKIVTRALLPDAYQPQDAKA